MNNYKVYKHIFPNNKIYIGITRMNELRRWRYDGSGYKGQFIFKAIQKYGWKNIKHEILFKNLNKEEAEQKEIELIAKYKSNQIEFGYNIANGGSHIGVVSNETKKKMSKTRKGLFAGEKNPMWHKEVSLDTRMKLSIANKGKHRSEETIKKIAFKNKGKKRTMESRIKMSIAAKGKIISEITRQKLREASIGRKHTEETKNKISKNNKGKHNVPCPEYVKEKISKANSGKNNFFYGKHHTEEVKTFLSNRLSKPIICIENGIEYKNSQIAAKMLGNKDRTNINHALLGKTKTAYGFHWRYKNEL